MRKSLCRAIIAFTFIVLFSIPRQALAWGSPGHMAVAYVAWRQLNDKEKARVTALLKLNTKYYKIWTGMIPAGTPQAKIDQYVFMMAATWPDEIKGTGSGYHQDGSHVGDVAPTDGTATNNIGYTDKALHKYWHFVDTSFSSDHSGPADPPLPNAKTQIEAFTQVLAAAPAATAAARKKQDLLKSYDLVWIEHLVGDVHQPLHCESRFIGGVSDGGANEVNLTNTPGDLHGYWDDLPGKGTTKNFAVAENFAQSLPPAPDSQASITDVSKWVDESYQIATSEAYLNPPIGTAFGKGATAYTLTTAYENNAMDRAKQRVALAGARLANLIKANLQ